MAKKFKRKPMADINVVPYIDVMLVLLVIFMISTPLLTQGVKVELPKQSTEILELDKKDTLIAKVDPKGNFYLTLGNEKERQLAEVMLVEEVRLFREKNPQSTVLVAGDAHTDYEQVMKLIVLLNQSGVEKVGLMTKPLDQLGQ